MNKSDVNSLNTPAGRFIETLTAPRPRRSLLKGAITGVVAGAALSTTTLLPAGAVYAQSNTSDKQKIFDTLTTLEQLAVTFYSAATNLFKTGVEKNYLDALLIEEQIHEQFFEALGGNAPMSTFSFPADTFKDVTHFLQAQQNLEDLFASAYLAGVKELASQGEGRLAQIFAQIASVEAEHRLIGKLFSDLSHAASTRAFEPVFIPNVYAAFDVLKKNGYLDLTASKTYIYAPVSVSDDDTDYRTPYIAF